MPAPKPDALRERARRLLSEGQSLRAVAAELGVGKSTVAEWVKGFSEPSDDPGVMVAFFLGDAGRQIALKDGDVEGRVVPTEDLHLTLAYLGKASGIEDPDRLKRVVAGFAAIAPRIAAEISGIGRFATGDRALYASVDAPKLPLFRHRLVEHLKIAGFPPNEEHGYTPHVTIAYPTSKVALGVEPFSLTFAALGIAIGADRTEYPLEGAALMADRFLQLPPPGFENLNPVVEQIGAIHPPTSPAQPLPIEREEQPPVVDRLWFEAMTRYINLIRNGVAHHHALSAVKLTDPNFDLEEEEHIALVRAIAERDHEMGRPVLAKMGWSAGTIAPPSYVQDVYAEFEMGQAETSQLADILGALSRQAYLEGINEQLMSGGLPLESSITDPAILREIDATVRGVADGIVSTYNRQLGNTVYATWVDLYQTRGNQSSRAQLEDAIGRWADQRASWKAEQIAGQEVARHLNQAGRDFRSHNPDAALMAQVEPGGAAQCEKCQEYINMGSFPADQAALIDLPAHVGCDHRVVVTDWAPGWSVAGYWSAQAPLDEAMAG